MKCRTFNSHYMPRVNEEWAGRVLNMKVNYEEGPDLIDEHKSAEVKFVLADKNYPLSWTVLEHQMKYNTKEKPCYWVLGTYHLKKPVKSIRMRDIRKLESLVTVRDLYIVTWDWMNQYPASVCTGQTEKSSWRNTFRYPKLRDLPGITHVYEVDKGLVHLTEGVPKRAFDIEMVNI